MANDISFPYPLPYIRRFWKNSTVLGVAQRIYDDALWDALPILADALEEAGCTDNVVLMHLRMHKAEPCWEKTCWLINHILEKEQKLRAKFRVPNMRDAEDLDEPACNPGEWRHYRGGAGCFAMGISCGYSSGYVCVVEASGPSDAEDEFVDSYYGVAARIDMNGSEAKDYGHHVNGGDQICGYVVKELGWVDLTGQFFPEGTKNYLTEPGITGGGTYYDTESVIMDTALDVRYYGPGLPPCMVRAEDYCEEDCDNCGRLFFPNTDGSPARFCSERCELAWTAPTDARGIECPVCEHRCEFADDGSDVAPLPFHFPVYSSSNYAQPAADADDAMEDPDGNVTMVVCPGSAQLGKVVG